MTNTLFLMVARGGSRGVPGKNLKKLGNLSLIGWKARAAQQAMAHMRQHAWPSRLVISTDSPEIAAEARAHGVEVPFIRPAELATDTAASVDVIRHALETLAADGQQYEHVVLLEPSAPFATGDHIFGAFEDYWNLGADLVVGMKTTEPHSSFVGEMKDDRFITPIIMRMQQYGVDTRRQARKQEWSMAGTLYIFGSGIVMNDRYIDHHGQRSIYNGSKNIGYLMDRWHSIEIDTPHDLEMAEYCVARGYVKVPKALGWVDRVKAAVG